MYNIHLSAAGECKWHFHSQTTKALTSSNEEHQPALASDVLSCLPWIWESPGKFQRWKKKNLSAQKGNHSYLVVSTSPWTCTAHSSHTSHPAHSQSCCRLNRAWRLQALHCGSVLPWNKQPHHLGAERATRFTHQKHHSSFWVGMNLGRTIRNLFP